MKKVRSSLFPKDMPEELRGILYEDYLTWGTFGYEKINDEYVRVPPEDIEEEK